MMPALVLGVTVLLPVYAGLAWLGSFWSCTELRCHGSVLAFWQGLWNSWTANWDPT